MATIIEKTNGKKTESLGLLMIAFQALTLLKPDLLTPQTQNMITFVISTGVIPTLLHRAWRNRNSIKEGFKNVKSKISNLIHKKNE